jgi:hypothetical protein
MEINDIKEIVESLPEEKVAQLKKELYLQSKSKGVLDAIQERVISRKLLVFAAATSLFMWFGLDTDTWGMIAMCYIGGQSAIDFAKTWKG